MKKFKIKNKKFCTIILLFIAVIPTFCTSFLYKKMNSDEAIDKIINSLYTIGKDEEKKIVNKSDSILNNLNLISHTECVQTLEPEHFDELIEFVKGKNKEVYDEILVIDKNYSIVYGNNFDREVIKEKECVKSAINGQTKITPLTKNEKVEYIEIGVPIFKEDKVIGLIYSKVNLNFLNESVISSRFIDETTESYIVDKNGVLVTESRFVPDSVGNLRVDIKKVKASIDYSKQIPYKDYRGKDVYGVYFDLPFNDWTLIVEDDHVISQKNNKEIVKIGEIMAMVEALIIAISKKGLDSLTKSIEEGNYDENHKKE
ncbi:cache domain-containing protein [Clostridium oceanicum]|uniref:Cache domain-containing protein n=1 Tax=Clostridium oceanicum TaxID=1543 RepID=A0ABN1JGI0_9CLOT